MHKAIIIKNLSLRIEASDILKNINLEVYKGDFITLIGENGSGKSSLLKVLGGIYNKYKGSKAINGKLIFVEQSSDANLFTDMTVYENFCLFCYGNNLTPSPDFARQHFSQFDGFISENLDKQVSRLSGGQKQKLIISLYLLLKPDILLLDEFTSALDPKSQQDVLEYTADAIKQLGITCIMIIHHFSEAIEYGNKLIAMKNGELVFHFYEEQKQSLSKENLLSIYYN